jgi:hypothetical protein
MLLRCIFQASSLVAAVWSSTPVATGCRPQHVRHCGSISAARRRPHRPSLIPVNTGRPGDLLAVARHPRFIPKVTVMEPHVHALSLPIDLLL